MTHATQNVVIEFVIESLCPVLILSKHIINIILSDTFKPPTYFHLITIDFRSAKETIVSINGQSELILNPPRSLSLNTKVCLCLFI